ncbi:ARM repeat-containing protein [Durotheca rogersii]|uniref:ARM repeat-containing protein n=1 Tax=Durotheca rogersii TaxID=419775 RepID=UPI00221E7729|nr:ARM repeat-containing protein [Durotheca rogersii]KAI5863985.1 ARM repeat-containing protein [Durotheca rogersii]
MRVTSPEFLFSRANPLDNSHPPATGQVEDSDITMPKPRSRRQALRDERKAKKHEKESAAYDGNEKTTKKRRLNEAGDAAGDEALEREARFQDGYDGQYQPRNGGPQSTDREFFGMLSDQEQEYFRSVDEQLDIDDFPSHEDRQLYLGSVLAEAQGKELKLACSQSCSRLMERLILMSNTRQKKQLFGQFAGHFLTLIQHRFASHCCETLFLQSAPIVTRELGGERDDMPTDQDDPGEQPLSSMEELYLLTLDELEGSLGYLLTDRFASHTLRVLLIILSGRPLEQSQTKSLIHSKKKEHITVPWTSDGSAKLNSQPRAVPASFTLAAKKIIADSISDSTPTELRILATHPTGNPVLQLMLELDISLNEKSRDQSDKAILLPRLLPGAPASLKDSTTPASDFVNSMLYDPIGSRLLETLITHCPGGIFKAMYKHIFASRIHSLLRNDIASYPAIRVLNRLSKEDLAQVVEKTLPEISKLVALSRFNAIKALFQRCEVRHAQDEIGALTTALVDAFGPDPTSLVPKLCLPQAPEASSETGHGPPAKSHSALASHGSQLATALLAIPGAPRGAVQTSLAALPAEVLVQLATSSHVLAAALSTPSRSKILHKTLVAALRPHAFALAVSEPGSRVLAAVAAMPCAKQPPAAAAAAVSLPFHLKESVLALLAPRERELRDSAPGRRVWRAWKGDLWTARRREWIAWAKEVDGAPAAAAPAPEGRRPRAPREAQRERDAGTWKRKRGAEGG